MDVGKEVSNHYKISSLNSLTLSPYFCLYCACNCCVEKVFEKPNSPPLGCFSHLSIAFIFSTWFKECTLIWTLSEKHSTERKMLAFGSNMNGKSSKLVDQRHHCSVPALSVPKTSLFQPTLAWPPLQSLSIRPKSQAKHSSGLSNPAPYFPPDTTQV